MCGISGIIGHKPQREQIESMMATIRHRGPDDHGFYIDDHVGFGHVRLAIVDLSKAGAQPMRSPDGRYVIIYNGEFYNHNDFRPDLEASGVTFRGHSDTETLLWLLIRHGEAILPRINGIFAFAFYDTHEKTVLLARDQMGVKPLYYAMGKERLLFASEIKALFATGDIEPRLNIADLTEHFMFHFVAGDKTLFEGVHELLPGHYLKIEPGYRRVERYWSPVRDIRNDLTEAEIGTTGQRLLADAIERQLMSDVSLGIMLSGGLDSSAVAAFSAPHRDRMLGYCFHDPAHGYDELSNAQVVADAYNIELKPVTIPEDNIPDLLIKMTRYYDEPLPRPHTIAALAIAQEARTDGVKVLLTGEGGDELFGGYQRYVDLGHQMLETGDYSPLVFANNRVALPRIQRFWNQTAFSNAYRFWVAEDVKHLDIINQQLLADQKTFLQHFLQRSDRTGMGAGVETRVPLLDIALVEFINSLPGEAKITNGTRKKVLRQAVTDVLDPRILAFPKQPFLTPMETFLRSGTVASMLDDLLLSNPRCGVLFPPESLVKLVQEMRSTTADPHLWKAVWVLLTTEVWLREFNVAI